MIRPKETFQRLVSKAIYRLYDDMTDSVRHGNRTAFSAFDMPDGSWVEISTDYTDDAQVICYHMRENGNRSPNVEQCIMNLIPTWTEAVAEVIHDQYIDSFN